MKFFESTDVYEGFRPLTGIMVLIVTMSTENKRFYWIKFPSPYGDYGSYRQKNWNL